MTSSDLPAEVLMALPAIPDWLSKRAGTLTAGVGEHTVFVVLGGQPQYRLDARPAAKGEFTCNVTQTNNGRRLDADAKFPDRGAAFAGGLDALRGKLGW